ncbi:uncharacterized protein LOC120479158 [Pimephales promelas]|uniref:uncharacterized protein LOC120479158 n=1 Tax=Pimephales promelas TaxID=90988 RepID=UPI001955997D|nr:uncharacterized protein LOC120479158 [Pimephales promelas]
MMAGRMKSRRTLSLLILLILLSLTELFEVKEELILDHAGLHRLRGLSEHMFHDRLKNPADHRLDIDQRWQCEEGFASCDTQMEPHVDEQKTPDRPISASEMSHSYSQNPLAMTDKEKPTEDRVQQEYSMDPHHSVMVSKECLFNVSCVPEADSDTVSEDGQTVSGLKAVLETDQENHQIMNQPDSVSLYQTPQRPVDHSTQYDHQQILIMQDDPTVRKAAASLYEKRPTVTSVYALDKHQRPKLIHGVSVPLSEDSRLTLVGHGERDRSGETRLAGYTAQDVARIIQQTFRTGDKIKTTSVLACEVGSDKEFVETLLRELHESANIETELHLRKAVLQVRHTGDIITQDISKQGVQWRHNDDSKKVVATLDRNGHVIIRNKPGRRGEEVFTNETNFLMNAEKKQEKKSGNKGATSSPIPLYRSSWPEKPRRFIDQNVFDKLDPNYQTALNELEALSWAFFHEELPLPQKAKTHNQNINPRNYLIGDKIKLENTQWLKDQEKIKVLSNCYVINTARDVRSIIRHYAKDGEDWPSYLMVKDWIFFVDPKSLYVYPVGKKLDQNDDVNETKKQIRGQVRKESYTHLQGDITNKYGYAYYVTQIFRGAETKLDPDKQLAYTTYFAASVIAESARNFRTFPLILMAVEMVEKNINGGTNFLNEEHSMARGGSWINQDLRGFSGAATSTASSQPSTSSATLSPLQEVIGREVKLYDLWIHSLYKEELDGAEVKRIAEQFNLTEGDPAINYDIFKSEMNVPRGASASG